jgi:hypothetical protein
MTANMLADGDVVYDVGLLKRSIAQAITNSGSAVVCSDDIEISKGFPPVLLDVEDETPLDVFAGWEKELLTVKEKTANGNSIATSGNYQVASSTAAQPNSAAVAASVRRPVATMTLADVSKPAAVNEDLAKSITPFREDLVSLKDFSRQVSSGFLFFFLYRPFPQIIVVCLIVFLNVSLVQVLRKIYELK